VLTNWWVDSALSAGSADSDSGWGDWASFSVVILLLCLLAVVQALEQLAVRWEVLAPWKGLLWWTERRHWEPVRSELGHWGRERWVLEPLGALLHLVLMP
jgi:hypothetical protein